MYKDDITYRYISKKRKRYLATWTELYILTMKPNRPLLHTVYTFLTPLKYEPNIAKATPEELINEKKMHKVS